MIRLINIISILLAASLTLNGQVKIYGKLPTTKEAYFKLTNFNGTKFQIRIEHEKYFNFKIKDLPKGFYNLEGIGTIYLNKGFNLRIIQAPKGKSYSFSGYGSVENNAFTMAKEKLADFISLDKSNSICNDIADTVFLLEPQSFLQEIDNFKNAAKNIFEKSNDTFFVRIATMDIEFYCKEYLRCYNIYYGKNLISQRQMQKLDDSISILSLDEIKQRLLFYRKQNHKSLPFDYTILLNRLIYDWDKNDETLFKNSRNYRDAFDDFFQTASLSGKYLQMPYNSSEDRTIKLLTILNDTVSNPFILNYFKYKFYIDIIQETKDTAIAGKYYREFLSQNTRQDYARQITEMYKTKIKYSSGMPAPVFTFSTTDSKPVALHSLRGKYVYIDVWATWCGPCVKEIPYLQKLESEYKGRDIQFVSISVDKVKDKMKWKNYVVNNKLGGIQLIADKDFESGFIKNMGINAIPRFILIDPHGKLVAADAPRPSDAELTKLLNKLL